MQFRAVFIGTKDIMPALGIGALRSNVELTRPATARTGISAIRNIGTNVNSVEVTVRHENWDVTYMTSAVTLLVGAGYTTVETHDTLVETVAPDNPDAIIRTYTFNLASARTSYRYKEVASTTSNLHCSHISEVADIAFA
jgi:hypothetical protein